MDTSANGKGEVRRDAPRDRLGVECRVVDLEARANRNRGGEIPAGLRLPQRADRRDLAVRVPIGARDTRVVRRGIADEPNERDRSAATLDEVNRLLDERVIARRR